MSRREFARRVGVDEKAVRKAIDAGRIELLPDGSIDEASAIERWEKTTDPARTKVGGRRNDGGDFQAARTRDVLLKTQERELKLAERRKELVPLAKVQEHVAKAFISFRQVIQRLPSRHVAAIAAELGCDAGILEAALSKAIAAELDGLSSPVVRA